MSSPVAPIGKFEFVTISALRAAQLMRGCTPRVPPGIKLTTTARMEVAGGKVLGVQRADAGTPIVEPS
jgi:DNA-directed RNA polymerase subunit K/omega